MAKVKDTTQVNGKLDDSKEPTTLEQIWGDSGMNKYGTMNATEYEAMLDGFNKSDLQSHAAKLGIMPIENRQRLKDSLLKAFKRYVATFNKPKLKPNPNAKIPDKRILDILAEGR